ncbi:nitrous oxide reductase accessory protein NosL [Herminiimonas sp. CN]|uniref:nitrous oxide reductase accessory protein NosL n=1 Tax=Herminiimonas sp. CN TaxID=1349818 RepID=UPI001EE66A9E|nr:nitrous oxide reductase accessory protein NosL [Herminiimonas sp. CN]
MKSTMIGWHKLLPVRHKLAASLLLCILLTACNQAIPKVTALEPTSDTACELDGMILKDYPGPKAQIHYAEGKPEFFCDLMELFMMVLAPEQKRPMAAVFVQDMGKTSWEHPAGNWIDAKSAVYVVGSKKLGSMGPTFGSFSRMQDAEAFAQKEGGKVLRFDQITQDMLNRGGNAAHDTTMSH